MQGLAETLPQVITIFGLGFFTFWFAIVTGLALGLSPVVVVVTISLSYMFGVALVTLLGSGVRTWIMKQLGKKTTLKSDSFLGRIWNDYGVIGLGLIAPLTTGSIIGAAIGIAMNANPRQLFIWMCVGAIGWSIIITVLVTMGVLGAQAVTQ
jgi:hypothetical protein